MDRSKMISQLEDPSEVFDFLVIGGGATGIGIALDLSLIHISEPTRR